ncbi:hypothetical protein [Thalassospira sp. MCCC 1A02491]|uniref:hypothetical protein n=1 Tax=Thalassospira sp. MCCC 1A02491 TaxID=1769751 RepID=UPI000AB2761F|nr:hypothetical protein [Thalassospira sp. MCCC 1A02491]
MQYQQNNAVIIAVIASFIGGLAAITALLLFGAYPDLSAKPFYQGTIKILYDWQSLIGVIVSAALAVGLFKYQRHLDLEREKQSFRFLLTRALKRTSTHPAKIKLDIAANRIESCRVSIERLRRVSPAQEIRTTCANALYEIEEVCGVFAEIMASIPRTAYFDLTLTSEIDDLDNAFRKFIMAVRLIHNETQSDRWNDRGTDGTPKVIFNAQQVILDIRSTLENISVKISELENNAVTAST